MKTRSSLAKVAKQAGGRFILLLILGAVGPLAFAFSVGKINISGISAVGDPNHEAITLAALAGVSVTLSGSQVKFSDKASNSIRDWNVDTDSKYWNLTEVHFDDEDFNEGNLLLFGLRASIKKRAIDGKYDEARELLGRALHTVQDFYAHSTWVEKGFSGLAPLALQSSSLFVKSSGATCTDSPSQLVGSIKTGIILDSQLTGEYFDLEQLTGNVLWSNFSSKCIHGSSKYSNNQALGAGINKDTAKRDFFSDAKTKAVAASKQFVEVVLGDLAGNENAIRGLLGQPLKTTVGPFLVKAGDTLEVTFVFDTPFSDVPNEINGFFYPYKGTYNSGGFATEIFNGNLKLGSNPDAGAGGAVWITYGAPGYFFGGKYIIDFSSIISRTIQGRMTARLTNNVQLNFDPNLSWTVRVATRKVVCHAGATPGSQTCDATWTGDARIKTVSLNGVVVLSK